MLAKAIYMALAQMIKVFPKTSHRNIFPCTFYFEKGSNSSGQNSIIMYLSYKNKDSVCSILVKIYKKVSMNDDSI